MGEDPVAQAVSLLRSQRHSIMNHLQVVSGWLQLQRPDRAAQYIDMLAARLAADAEVLRQVPPETGLLVLDFALEAETYGVTLDWQVHSPISAPDAAAPLKAELSAALKAAATAPEPRRRISVTLGPESTVTVHTPTSAGEG